MERFIPMPTPAPLTAAKTARGAFRICCTISPETEMCNAITKVLLLNYIFGEMWNHYRDSDKVVRSLDEKYNGLLHHIITRK